MDYRMLPFCQLEFKATQSVRKSKTSEWLPAGLSCWETGREYLQWGNLNSSPVFLITNLGKRAFEGSYALRRIQVLLNNSSDSLSICQTESVDISLQHTDTHKCTGTHISQFRYRFFLLTTVQDPVLRHFYRARTSNFWNVSQSWSPFLVPLLVLPELEGKGWEKERLD